MFTDATSAILFPWIKGNLTNKYIAQLYDLRNYFSVKQFYNINLWKCFHYIMNKYENCCVRIPPLEMQEF